MEYKLKCKNEDFQVTEVPLFPDLVPKNLGLYSYVWIRKSGFNTFDTIDLIKKFFRLGFDGVCNQGLKDEEAITEQIISIKKILNNRDLLSFNKKHTFGKKFVTIKYLIGYGKEPVKEKVLHGNSFRIVVRNLENKLANKIFHYVLHNNHPHQIINYYDNQRFGLPGGHYNTHLIGKAIVENNWKEAYKQIKKTDNPIPREFKKTKTSNFKDFFKLINPHRIYFFVAAYNSLLWNKKASEIIKKHTKSKNYHFENLGKLYLPTNNSFQCPPICEHQGYEFVKEDFIVKPKKNSRNIITTTKIYIHNLEKDEMHKGKKKLTLSFFISTGNYGTMVIKQIILRAKAINL